MKRFLKILFRLRLISTEVTFYMEGTHQVKVKCWEFKGTRLTSNSQREVELINARGGWTVDLDKVVAITFKTVYF